MPVSVDLPLSVGIPVDYVPDQNLRLRLYRRLADLESEAEVQALLEEFNDRFGPPPEPVQNLFFQMQVKLLAQKVGLASVILESEQIVLRYPPLRGRVSVRAICQRSIIIPAPAKMHTGWHGTVEGEDWQERLIAGSRQPSLTVSTILVER
jgi:transcription-repair coupling factor (superfamily II helicase)